MGSEEPSSSSSSSQKQKKTYWRSASWSSSRSDGGDLSKPPSNGGHPHRSGIPNPPLTPRSKPRPSLLPPLSIARRPLDDWPKPGSDDLGLWPLHPPTPSSSAAPASSSSTTTTKNQIALFDKECSKVADHVYIGGDSVARDRSILRAHGITHVLNCVGSVCPDYFKPDLVYRTLWLQDSPSEDITSILYDVFDYFEDVRSQRGARVLVHCCQGVSRSASLVIAYLMWRKGQSFDDAFRFVKAARGIADPNMGFACQLLQCQKRVHAVPLSPNSVLRVYRMAPHSPYDPLHLVPKMLGEPPSPASLDSRGAFLVHVASAIFVWVGEGCHPAMEKDARAAAFQVVRYERVPGPLLFVEEGDEPREFWDAFSAPNAIGGGGTGAQERASKPGPLGKKRVEDYNVDFELFNKAIIGGVVPPFPSSRPGQETCLPARESNWSILRRKFISGARDRVQILTTEAATSPCYPSPSSLSSNSSASSKYCYDSPSMSPSTCSSPSLTPTSFSDPSLSPSRPLLQISNSLEPLKPCLQADVSPSKSLSRSIAERRGSFSLKLPLNATDTLLVPRKSINGSPNCDESKQEVLERSNGSSDSHKPEVDALGNSTNCIGQVQDTESLRGSAFDSSIKAHSLPNSTESVGIDSHMQPSVYSWPDMKKLTKFSREDLDSKRVFFMLSPKRGRGEESDTVLFMWIGSRFELTSGQTHLKSCKDVDEVTEIDWVRIGCDFIALMDLPNDLPVKVVKVKEDEEQEDFLEFLKSN